MGGTGWIRNTFILKVYRWRAFPVLTLQKYPSELYWNPSKFDIFMFVKCIIWRWNIKLKILVTLYPKLFMMTIFISQNNDHIMLSTTTVLFWHKCHEQIKDNQTWESLCYKHLGLGCTETSLNLYFLRWNYTFKKEYWRP